MIKKREKFTLGRLGRVEGLFVAPSKSALEGFRGGGRAQEVARTLPEGSGVDFWRHFGSQNGVFWALF